MQSVDCNNSAFGAAVTEIHIPLCCLFTSLLKCIIIGFMRYEKYIYDIGGM